MTIKQTSLAALCFIALAHAAVGQDAPRPPAPMAGMMEGPGDHNGPEGPDGGRSRSEAEPRGPGAMHAMPPPAPPKGIELDLGEGRGLRVTCGDAPFETCMAAAHPVLRELVGLLGGGPVPPRGPDALPPPRDAMPAPGGEAPPAPGEALPPSLEGEAPPPPAADAAPLPPAN